MIARWERDFDKLESLGLFFNEETDGPASETLRNLATAIAHAGSMLGSADGSDQMDGHRDPRKTEGGERG